MPRHPEYNPPLDLDAISVRMRELRGRLALTQAETAREMGVRPRTFQSWEYGEASTTKANYDAIAEFYSEKLGEVIRRSQILYGTKEPPPPLPGWERGARGGLRDLEARMRAEMEQRIDGLRLELRQEFGGADEDAHAIPIEEATK